MKDFFEKVVSKNNIAEFKVTANNEESALKRLLKNMNKEEEKKFKKMFG